MVADEGRERPVRRQLGVQGRLTLFATALVAIALVAGALLLALILKHTLLSTLDDSARQRAQDVASLVNTGNLPRTVPTAGGTVLVQVVDDHDRVRAASPGGDALVPLLSGRALADVRKGRTQIVPGSRIGIADRLRVVATTAGPTSDRRTVLVAVSSSEAEHSLRTVSVVLAIGVPLLLAGFGVVCWFLVGAALRPVAALRQGAGAISETDDGARLPVPGTGDEVARLAETLNDMLDRLAAGGARQRSFVADAAHELRSPLASIRTQLEVARAHPDAASWADTADGVLLDVARLTRLVDDLLLLARLDHGGPAARRSGPLNLRAMVLSAAGAGVRRLPVAVDDDDDSRPVLVDADPDGVARILDNLLSNADRYATGSVTVAVRELAETATVTVTDDGPGIAASDRDRVFQRFARVDDSRSEDLGGSGLGLAIVHELTHTYGGTVELQDARPGLRVVVTLPRSGRGRA
jgi:signal transduction histidine kinase